MNAIQWLLWGQLHVCEGNHFKVIIIIIIIIITVVIVVSGKPRRSYRRSVRSSDRPILGISACLTEKCGCHGCGEANPRRWWSILQSSIVRSGVNPSTDIALQERTALARVEPGNGWCWCTLLRCEVDRKLQDYKVAQLLFIIIIIYLP